MTQTILIVDDHREIIRLLTVGLETLNHDFTIKHALSGEEALLEARFTPIDLLISDVRLPGISGLDLVKDIQEIQPEVSIIMLTGQNDPDVQQAFLNIGVEHYFVKPVEIADFLDAIIRLLGLEGLPQKAPAPAIEPRVPPPTGISERLVDLRSMVNAISVTMLTESGQVAVQAGELVDAEIEAAWIPSIMAVFSAGTRIGLLLGEKTPNQAQIFHGNMYDLLLVPVGPANVLLIATKEPLVGQRAGLVIQAVDLAVADINRMLENIGLDVVPPEEVEAPVEEIIAAETAGTGELELDSDMEALFAGEVDGAPLEIELDDFWEEEAEDVQAGNINADALSFDQARRLGLTPDED